MKRATTSAEAPTREGERVWREQLQALRLQRVYIYWRESVKRANPRKHFDQSKNPPETSSLMSEQANQLHNPPVMFNEREITFYTFLNPYYNMHTNFGHLYST